MLFVVLALAMATQLFVAQLTRAQTTTPSESPPQPTEEKFVPGTGRYLRGATLELRSQATVVGREVTLKQVCRWSEADAAVFQPIQDMVLLRLSSDAPFKAISLDEIKQTLHDGGVSLAAINFAGSMSCMVERSDVQFDEGAALRQWMARGNGNPPAPAAQRANPPQVADDHAVSTEAPSAPTPATPPNPNPRPMTRDEAVAAAAPASSAVAPEDLGVRSLRQLLVDDLAQRLKLPADSLEVKFKPEHERLLAITTPHFQFSIQPLRAGNLGEVSWNVTMLTDAGPQRITIGATARAWQPQLIVAKPLTTKQIIRDEDVVERRALIDRIGDDLPIARAAAVGQQAARDLKPGTVLTGRMVDAVQLVKPGQLVTVTLSEGNIQVRTVAKALEGGAFGQSVRVRNETTREVFRATLTGPQTATLSPGVPDAKPAAGGTDLATVAE
jgi:flagella basal body P-ring formation protein FlgA